MEKKEFKPYPDAGALYASQSKKFPKSPDYWGTIAINLKDLTNVQTVDGLTVFKLSGWKKQGSSGKTYLSIGIDRYVPEQTSRPQERRVENDDDNVPF